MNEERKEGYVEEPRIFERNLDTVMHEAMMPYAEYVILDRAIPRLEDGLKPVQRRVLYAMHELGLTPDKPFKKCARIVGECLGKYHPHGDTSVYDALARLAQDFNMGEILVDGQGNYGSADGDKQAAMRYTEARLAPLAMEMLRDIDKETVDFGSNFDDTLKEPTLLPGRFPNLLVNGANGIAIGLATNIPTHNLSEVVNGTIAYIEGLIKKKPISLDTLMTYIPAPDFPTGGEIIPLQMKQAYETGKGRILMRAKFKIEREGDRRNIVFTEFPYQTNKLEIMKKIMEDKDKGKFEAINDVVDESDREGQRVVVKLVKNADINSVLTELFRSTELAKGFNLNMVAIAGGKPKLLSLVGIIDHYCKYQRDVIKKRSQFDLARAKEREEVLTGLMVAVNNIDEVIRIIKKANNTQEARSTLRVRFTLSEKQANAILEMRLKSLTSLEIEELKKQLQEIRERIDYLSSIVGSETKQYQVVIEELKEIKRKYGKPRRSFISATENDIIDEVVKNINETERGYLVTRANGTVVFTKKSSMGGSNRDASAFDVNNAVVDVQECSNDTILYAFTDKGNFIRIYTDSIGCSRLRDRGFSARSLTSAAKADEKIVKAFTVKEEDAENYVIAHFTSGGSVRYAKLTEFGDEKTSFGAAIKLKSDDEKVIAVELVKDEKIVMVSQKGYAIRVDGSDIMVKGRLTLGASAMKVGEDDVAVMAGYLSDDSEILLVNKDGRGKRILAQDIPVTNKNCRGTSVYKNLLFAGASKATDTLMLGNEEGDVRAVPVQNIVIDDIYDKGDYVLENEVFFVATDACLHKLSN